MGATEKLVFYLAHEQARRRVIDAIQNPQFAGWKVTIAPPSRTLDQNALMWPLLTTIEQQLEWPVLINHRWQNAKMTAEEWKDFLTANFKRDIRKMAQGLDGTGLVMVGTSTSKMSKLTFSEFIEFIYYFGANYGVDLS